MLVERIGIVEFKVTLTQKEFLQLDDVSKEEGKVISDVVKEVIELSIQRFFHV